MANTSKRGFASMDSGKQRLIASKGGKAAHAKGTAHEWSSDEARAAGRKGGESRGTHGEYATLDSVNSTGFLNDSGSSLRNASTYNTPSYPQQRYPSNSNATIDGYAPNLPHTESGIPASRNA